MSTICFLSLNFLGYGFVVLAVAFIAFIVFFLFKDKNDKERILQEQKEKEVMQGQIGNLSTGLETTSDDVYYLTRSMVKDKVATASHALNDVVGILTDLKDTGRLPIPAADAMILQLKSGMGTIAPTASLLVNALDEHKKAVIAKQKVLTPATPQGDNAAKPEKAVEGVPVQETEGNEVKTA